jgi:hypothetical protein
MCLILTIFTARPLLSADRIIARTTVESNNVYVGESFLMQITIMGSTDAKRPNLDGLEGFDVEFVGGSNNSSQSVSIVNGSFSRTVKKEYVFTYRLTPRKTGVLSIPSFTVEVDGKGLKTNALAINTGDPEETEDFKLRLRLSRKSCYVGEPVMLSVVWYLRQDVNSFHVTAPFLETPDFDIEKPEVVIDKRKNYFRVPIGGEEFIALKSNGTLEGTNYTTLEFKLALIPKRSGLFNIPKFIVSCETGGGLGGDDFFNGFFSRGLGSRQRKRKFVVPSNSPTLSVKELPKEGRPVDFSGYVGEYKISSSASPIEVDVGDPITLIVTLQGSDYMENLTLPPLGELEEFSKNFKIPSERAAGVVKDGKKIFTQTIRAKDHSVTRIPPIRFVSFDTAKERYLTVESDPIPITVNSTRTVTASDAEGLDRAPEGSMLEHWRDGIAYNYKGEAVMARMDYGFGSLMYHRWNILLIGFPPALFVILLVGSMIVRSRNADPLARRARGSGKMLRRKLAALAKDKNLKREVVCGRILEDLKEYLGSKLRRAGSALTSEEIKNKLEKRGISSELTQSLLGIIEVCEHGRYAGASAPGENDTGSLIDRAKDIAVRLDKKL